MNQKEKVFMLTQKAFDNFDEFCKLFGYKKREDIDDANSILLYPEVANGKKVAQYSLEPSGHDIWIDLEYDGDDSDVYDCNKGDNGLMLWDNICISDPFYPEVSKEIELLLKMFKDGWAEMVVRDKVDGKNKP